MAGLVLGGAPPISAQGITTAVIRGTVRAQDGGNVEAALVRAVNVATGHASETRVRNGGFFLQGLATGGPYRIVVRSLGYSPAVRDGLSLALGEEREVDFTLVILPQGLDTLKVTANDNRPRLPTAGGVGTSVSDSSLRRLPTLNRDLYDFVRLTPQVSSRFGLSGGGASFRTNGYFVDGVSDRQLQGNNVPGGPNGGKSISLEAVKEYQVLLTPYDARYGDFTGLMVNAVTRSGTNDLEGSAYGFLRNAQLARDTSFVGSTPYQREQYGFSLGGPMVRDRVHFFIAAEFQHAAAPALGPYIGQSDDAPSPVPVLTADVTRFQSLLRTKGMEPGSGGRVTLLNPNVLLFGRLDVALPEWRSRVVLRSNYSRVNISQFARPLTTLVFPLSSSASTIQTRKRTAAVQVFTQTSTGVFNDLLVAYTDSPILPTNQTRAPSVQANVGVATLMAGLPAAGSGAGSRQRTLEVGDHLVFQPSSAHTLGVGARAELFHYNVTGVRNGLGQWRFASLDALASGTPSSFTIAKDFGSAESPVRGVESSVYVNDTWRVNERLLLTAGLRADVLTLSSRPAYNAAVDSIFQRRTSDYPGFRVQWSPRFGFTWESADDGRTTIHGGAGVFVGRPPLGWLLGPMRSNGAGIQTLSCSSALGPGRVPPFAPYPADQPTSCPDGTGFSSGPVALVDRDLRMAESFRTSLAVRRRVPWNVEASLEALYSNVRSDFVFSNADLRGPQGVDQRGRVMYGTIDSTGVARPSRIDGGRFGLGEVIDLRNQSRGYSQSVTAQISRPFSDQMEMTASYTNSRVRDVQSLISPSAVAPFDIWASGRMLSGRHDDQETGVSAFDIPHRVVLSATYVVRWRRGTTDISLYYIGESGAPFTYGDSTAVGLGDLNADGTAANDPIYVPRNASQPSEIVFAGSDSAAQGVAFEKFIHDTPCLDRQRGRIMARNSCRGAWVNTSNLSVRQSLPALRGHTASLQLEVFDLLNLLNSSWGLFQVPNAWILQHRGQTAGSSPQPRYRFDAGNVRNIRNLESGYQLQLALRYSF